MRIGELAKHAHITQMQRASDELEALLERARDLPNDDARDCPLVEHQLAVDSNVWE